VSVILPLSGQHNACFTKKQERLSCRYIIKVVYDQATLTRLDRPVPSGQTAVCDRRDEHRQAQERGDVRKRSEVLLRPRSLTGS